uniref:2-hydroxyacyl-CoA lyase n=1 Tax=Macrostomum lignano TaxID=282301 RepID=A0A1I8IW83_9PLAT
VDIHPEEFHTNVTCEVALCGSVAAVVEQLSSELHGFEFSSSSDWWRELNAASAANRARVDALIVEGQTVPMTYYSALNELAKFVDNSGDDWLIVSEGANTMDIGRAMLPNRLARRRLDAGTFGTMGVGLGFAAAADLCIGDSRVGHRRVLCLEGDSAVGFSLAELETLARYRMPVLLVVINNSGIYSGVPADVLRQLLQQDGAAPSSGALSASAALRLPATSLTSECRYDLAAEALGGYGRLVRSVGELRQAFAEFAGVRDRPCLINAIIDTGAERKQQVMAPHRRDNDRWMGTTAPTGGWDKQLDNCPRQWMGTTAPDSWMGTTAPDSGWKLPRQLDGQLPRQEFDWLSRSKL